MNISELKAKLGVETLNLNTAKDTNGNATDWLRHWDNDNRVAISIHKDTVAKIKAENPSTLGIQEETREGNQGAYIAKRIVLFNPAEVTL